MTAREQSAGGRCLVRLVTVAAIVLGCGSAPSEPLVDEAAALAGFQFTCGVEPFPATALSGPVGAEQEANPAAAALRALVAEPPVVGRPVLPKAGYRLLVRNATSAAYAAVSDQFDVGLAYVRLELAAEGWQVTEFGGCRPLAAFQGLNSATWQFAPDVPFPNGGSTSFTALVHETACTSGRSADGRVLPPMILMGATEVLVIFAVRPPPPNPNGLEACPAPPPTRVDVTLPKALGDRALLDGGVSPPADPHPEVVPIDIDPVR